MLVVVVASWSKSCQKSKNLKGLKKSAKVVGSEEPSFLTSDTGLIFTKMGSNRTHDGRLPAMVEAFNLPAASAKFSSSPIIPPTVQRYKRLELPLGLLGSRALLIPLSL